MVNHSFCKQAKWNGPGCNPVDWGGRPLMETGLPRMQKQPEGSRDEDKRRGPQQGEFWSNQAGSNIPLKRVNSVVCERGSFSCRKLEIKSKSPVWNEENKHREGKQLSQDYTATVRARTWTLVSSLQVILPSHSARITNSCAYRITQATEMQEAGQMWETIGQHCPVEMQWELHL